MKWYPTRLISVGNDLDHSPYDDRIRLVDTAKTPLTGQYMTLSHRWGGTVPLKLTRETDAMLRNGMLRSELPQTFADAVKITRWLGVGFLWIDSLCIEQDSEDDWRREAGQMGKVYEKSWCNIAATTSMNSSGGCFFDRDLAPHKPFQVESRNAQGQVTKTIWIEQESWNRQIELSPLDERAWVLQERVLAPRQLHFCRSQVFWECRNLRASEALPLRHFDGHVSPEPDYSRIVLLKEFAKFLEEANSGGDHQTSFTPYDLPAATWKLYVSWITITNRYARLGMTYPRDKLVALSGLAQRVKEATSDVYLAGLWKGYLHVHLLWCGYGVREGHARHRPLCAPTWTWASYSSGVCHDHYASYTYDEDQKRIAVVLDAWAEEITEKDSTKIADGFLRLLTPLWVATSPKGRGQSEIEVGSIDTEEIKFHGMAFLDENLHANLEADFEARRILCMPLIFNENCACHGLLLKEGQATQTYERIGIFLFYFSDNQDWYNKFLHKQEMCDYSGWHTVTVV